MEFTAKRHTGLRVDVVRIANFRSLRNVEVELTGVSLLVGMNNAGKTSFLRAIHLALGADRRLVSHDDFFVSLDDKQASEIVIDVRIVPTLSDEKRAKEFSQDWIDSDFGGELISFEADDKQYVAFRTRITHDAVKNDFLLERRQLVEWSPFESWQQTKLKSQKVPRFSQLASFLIDAQRDVVGDLKIRSSYLGKLLSKVEIPPEAVAELEQRLGSLNADIVSKSAVLSHVRDVLQALNRTISAEGSGVELAPVSKSLRDITKGLGMQFSDGPRSFPLENHGMGTRSWASLLSFEAFISWTEKLTHALARPFHPVLFLEEPEAHLHPNSQRSVYSQLSSGIGQRVVSTHSPYIAGQAKLTEIIHFGKSNGESRICRLPVADLGKEEIRKIRREVVHSRGELLFSRAAVLFEGETEEQSIPVFARHKWKCDPFRYGVSFVGVGGDGKYYPFLKLFQALEIPWFIFSDGEPDAVVAVNAALKKCGLKPNHPTVFTLPAGRSIERHLMAEGYEPEIKKAIIAAHTFQNVQHEQAKTKEITALSAATIEEYLLENKTSLAPYWAEAIIEAEGERSTPPIVRELLDAVAALINKDAC